MWHSETFTTFTPNFTTPFRITQRGLFRSGGCLQKWFTWFAWFLEIPELTIFERGLFSNFDRVVLVVSTVLVVASVKTNHPLPKQPPSSTLTLGREKTRKKNTPHFCRVVVLRFRNLVNWVDVNWLQTDINNLRTNYGVTDTDLALLIP